MLLFVVACACVVVAVVLCFIQGHVGVVLSGSPVAFTCASVWQGWTHATYEVFGGSARHRCVVQRRDHLAAAIVVLVVGCALGAVAGVETAHTGPPKGGAPV